MADGSGIALHRMLVNQLREVPAYPKSPTNVGKGVVK